MRKCTSIERDTEDEKKLDNEKKDRQWDGT